VSEAVAREGQRPQARAPARPLERPPRDLRLDVLRGWMQVSIFISHAAGAKPKKVVVVPGRLVNVVV